MLRDRGGHSLDGVLNCEGGVDIPSEEAAFEALLFDRDSVLLDRDSEAPFV